MNAEEKLTPDNRRIFGITARQTQIKINRLLGMQSGHLGTLPASLTHTEYVTFWLYKMDIPVNYLGKEKIGTRLLHAHLPSHCQWE